MYSLPFALSVHKFVTSIGDYIGFASLLAVALLVILYFAHAREAATLRDRLEDSNERVARLETRVAQLLQLNSIRAQQQSVAPPTVAPRPAAAVARPLGTTVAELRREAGAPALGGDEGERAATLPPAAPAGVGAPALASATRMVSSVAERVLPAAPVVANTAPVAPVALVGGTPDEFATGGEAGVTRLNPAAPVAGAIATNPFASSGTGRGAGAGPVAGADGDDNGSAVPPARVQIRPQQSGRIQPTGAGGQRSLPRRSVPLPPSAKPRRTRGGRLLRGLVGGLAAIVVIGAIVYGLVQLTSSGTSTPKQRTSVTTHPATTTTTAFNPAKFAVAVLNGTSTSGLAKDVSVFLVKRGFRKANITNAAVQTLVTSTVYYMPGEQLAAEHVATALGLAKTAIAPATNAVIQLCETSPTTAARTTCSGDVIVSVGSDQAKLAGTATSGD